MKAQRAKDYYLMLNRIIFIFTFCSSVVSAQEISPENNCDTITFNLLPIDSYLIENASCRMNGPAKILYFTSHKEFSDYNNNSKYPLNSSCLSQFNNFDFKKYNMLLVNYNYEKSTTKHIAIELRYEKDKYHVFIKHYWNKSTISLLLSENFDKCISLPKEKSIIKPKIYTCNIH